MAIIQRTTRVSLSTELGKLKESNEQAARLRFGGKGFERFVIRLIVDLVRVDFNPFTPVGPVVKRLPSNAAINSVGPGVRVPPW